LKNSTLQKHYIGTILIKDLFSDSGLLIIPESTVLTINHLIKLNNHFIRLNDKDVETVDRRMNRMINQSVIDIREIFRDTLANNQIPIHEFNAKILPIVNEAAKDNEIFNVFNYLHSMDDYTYRHNIAVGIIATMLGNWLDLDRETLNDLTIAATLHDIGKIKVPLNILNKPGKLTKKEFALMKKHTIFGYDLIKSTQGTSEIHALVALQHHEREDGTGYPFGLKASAVHHLSKIVAVADVFHAMTSDRVYRKAVPFYMILEQMIDNTFGVLDPNIMALFIGKIINNLIGKEVCLCNGVVGKVVMVYPNNPSRPLIQTADQFIDLSKDTLINIVQIL
jgi:HD-GYP domain-containing protein (c-di-GMP phosphodiesterase class II)